MARGTLRQWLEAYGTGSWFGYLYLDVHLPRRPPTRPVISQATVIAVGVSALGRREVLGMPVGDSESTDFWTEFLRSLRQRCLNPTRVTRHL